MEKKAIEYPKLREGVEAIPVVHEGRQYVLLKDQLGFSERSLLLSPAIIPVLIKMDGKNSIRDLQLHFIQTTGQFILKEKIEELIAELEESLFLEGERYEKAKRKQIEEFINSPIRKATYAGKSYPKAKEELKKMIDSFFDPRKGGPGKPDNVKNSKKIIGFVAPHIDLNLGGPTYAHGYKRLLEAHIPKKWIILGTSHGILENLFAITYKDFETPFGILDTDKDLISFIKDNLSFNVFKEEFSHKNEHTIEFQAIFFSYFWPDVKIIPVLCYFDVQIEDEDKKKIDEMIKVLREIVLDKDVGIAASVDFAHVGPRYGDRFIPNQSVVNSNLEMDKLLLDLLVKPDGDRFLEILRNENNRRKICGLAPLYVIAKVLEGIVSGEVTGHNYGYVDNQNSFVTFASMVYYKK